MLKGVSQVERVEEHSDQDEEREQVMKEKIPCVREPESVEELSRWK